MRLSRLYFSLVLLACTQACVSPPLIPVEGKCYIDRYEFSWRSSLDGVHNIYVVLRVGTYGIDVRDSSGRALFISSMLYDQLKEVKCYL